MTENITALADSSVSKSEICGVNGFNINNGLQLRVSPGMLGMLGRSVYKMPPLPICVRELLQNSVDACTRKGIDPDQFEISISIDFQDKQNHNECVLIVKDNGIGMTPEEVWNDFLVAGKASDAKYDPDDPEKYIGGFGIAKIALMRNPTWGVRTLKWEFDSDDLDDANPIRLMPEDSHIDGTEVWVHVTECAFGSLEQTLQMIYFSDVNVELTITREDETIFSDDIAGFHLFEDTTIQDSHTKTTETGNYAYTSIADDVSYGSSDSLEYEPKSLNVYRMNGLVQHTDYKYNNTRKANIIVDVYSPHKPQDDNYPLSVSRETLRDEVLADRINAIIKGHDADVLQANNAVHAAKCEKELETIAVEKGDEPPKPTYIHGSLLKGNRPTWKTRHTTEDPSWHATADQGISTAKDKGEVNESTTDGYTILMDKLYILPDSKRELRRVENLLEAWAIILQETAADDQFGIGLTGKSWVGAYRTYDFYTGAIFYILNPDILAGIGTGQGRALALWHLACHETAHAVESEHNEAFTKAENDIAMESATEFFRKMPALTRLLK